MRNVYEWRDDFYQHKMAGDIDADLANLRKHRVRYTNDHRSIMQVRVPYRGPYFATSGPSSSLVVA